MDLLFLFIALMTACFLSKLLIPYILLISFRKKLFDEPNTRKIHKTPIPRLGGVAFSPIIIFMICLFSSLHFSLKKFFCIDITLQDEIEHLFMISGLILLYIIGIADDLIGVRYRHKFLFQTISALMIPLSCLYINNFYGLFSLHQITPLAGILLTLLLIVFIVNSINLIDGIDGLASGLSIISFSIFGILFIEKGIWIYALSAFVCIGVLIPFFFYNVFGGKKHRRKIFMGDAGSLTLGYLLSFFAVKYCMQTNNVETNNSPILITFSILLIPCMDALRVALRRIRNKKNPFLPDKTHIHHKFLDMGFSPHATMILILLMSIGFFLFNAVSINYLNDNLVFIIDIAVWIGLNIWFDILINRRKKMNIQ